MNTDMEEVEGRMELNLPEGEERGLCSAGGEQEPARLWRWGRQRAGKGGWGAARPRLQPRFQSTRSPQAEVGEASFPRHAAPEAAGAEPFPSPARLSRRGRLEAAPAGERGPGRASGGGGRGVGRPGEQRRVRGRRGRRAGARSALRPARRCSCVPGR